jgi:hypothetical protein
MNLATADTASGNIRRWHRCGTDRGQGGGRGGYAGGGERAGGGSGRWAADAPGMGACMPCEGGTVERLCKKEMKTRETWCGGGGDEDWTRTTNRDIGS